MTNVLRYLIVGVCGVLGGLWLTYAALERGVAFGTVSAGPWTTAPRNGAADIDPYARATITRTGEIPLGAAEGVSLIAETDSRGQPLDARCVYSLEGPTPSARYWTVTATDPSGHLMADAAQRYGFTSSELLRDQDGAAVIMVGREAQAGNWLPVGAPGRFKLMLRLYDTVLSSSIATLDAAVLPRIRATACP